MYCRFNNFKCIFSLCTIVFYYICVLACYFCIKFSCLSLYISLN